MVETVFSCEALADSIGQKVAKGAAAFRKNHGRAPCLAVVLVGDDPASHIYVRKKGEAARKFGIDPRDHSLPGKTTEAELLKLIGKLNSDPGVDGILVQSPLPAQISEKRVQAAISPAKDVDGFHPENAGQLLIDAKAAMQSGLVPCTPAGVMEVLADRGIEVRGKHAVVVGRSNIVGKPMAAMLLAYDATVTICHSRTTDLAAECKRADILVSAVGKPHLIGAKHVKPGAVVIDVGISRVQKDGKPKIVGDVDTEAVRGSAALITPVPRGIGPMTIALLLRNTLRAAEALARP